MTKIFIANRGEIAQRILRTAHKMGLKVAVPVSKSDQDLNYLSLADTCVPVDEDLTKSFLNLQVMVDAALKCGANAVHPGYGFLSENAEFATMCAANKLIWIGPSPAIIKKMANKEEALCLAKELDIPVLKNWSGSAESLKSVIKRNDLPVIIKANNGGGGKGMQIVEHITDLSNALEKAAREALNLFGSGSIFAEQYISKARHIEVQVLGDNYGNAVHLYERECSVQRRFQKIIEEAPVNNLPELLRQKMLDAALRICHFVDYNSVGTVEFLVNENDFYFLEMNTRIQVEHPVTEEITGIDLIEQQIKSAMGEALSIRQNDVTVNGHALECRVYAEDAENGFTASPGTIRSISLKKQHGIRYETAIDSPQVLSLSYDALLSKVICWSQNRNEAIKKMESALRETQYAGVVTNSTFLNLIMASNAFVKNRFHTTLLDDTSNEFSKQLKTLRTEIEANVIPGCVALRKPNHHSSGEENVWHQIGFWRNVPFSIFIDDHIYNVAFIKKTASELRLRINNKEVHYAEIENQGKSLSFNLENIRYHNIHLESGDADGLFCFVNGLRFLIKRHQNKQSNKQTAKKRGCHELRAQLPGKVVKINVHEGSVIKRGEPLLIMESMKIENNIQANTNGIVTKINISEGQQLQQDDLLLIINHN